MKITRRQYAKAVDSLPQLRKAEEIITAWDGALASLGSALQGLEVIEIEGDPQSGFAVKARRKESGQI